MHEPTSAAAWRIWIDTGGTFTDAIAVDPSGGRHRCKVLSSGALRDRVVEEDGPGRLRLGAAAALPPGFLRGFALAPLGSASAVPITSHEEGGWISIARGDAAVSCGTPVELSCADEAPLLAARVITGTPPHAPLPPVAMRLATTRGTNALLERRGARLVHFTTAGFEDLLTIGDQRRPDLFALAIRRETLLPARTVGVDERLAADGAVLRPLDEGALFELIAELRSEGFECASIALLHGHRNPIHEERLEALLRGAGFSYVARSSTLSPFQGLLRRAHTAVADAYVGPVISAYLAAVERGMGADGTTLHVMTSAGGLVNASSFRPMDSLLSGPAGGVVGAAMSGREAGAEQVIAFDMGGTSTDVSRYAGDFEYVFSHVVGPVTLAAPALAIETVAAGGGSICRVEHGRLAVGPESAGADPGPACYGAGGPLTLTDVNLLLGRLVPERFPIPMDRSAAERRFTELQHELGGSAGDSDEAILEGLLRIADERMAEAIRHISVRKGIDPADHTLVAFGGAGAQHACRLAELLGIGQVVVPGDAGLLSAAGLGAAVLERFAQRELLEPLDEVAPRLDALLEELAAEAAADLLDEGVPEAAIAAPRVLFELRYRGQDAALEVEYAPDLELHEAFETQYRALFSYCPTGLAIEVVSLRVVLRSQTSEAALEEPVAVAEPATARPAGHQRCFVDGGWRQVPRFEAGELAAGTVVAGPALLQQHHSAVVLPGAWRAHGLGGGGLRLALAAREVRGAQLAPRPHAVELELMSHRFSSIAREMGEMLQRTAISTNIKEREDFSCTLLDAAGRLVVNAPHIPVHLGAMGLCVRRLAEHCAMAPGHVVVTNHPAFGGSHLPDVTMVAPVHVNERLLGYVACRAHHAEIGGIRPGSMPPDARCLAEEGVVLPPTLLASRSEVHWDRITRLLQEGPHPTRSLGDNLADLRAMLAALVRGREALRRLADRVGFAHVLEHMDALYELAAAQVRSALARRPDGRHEGRQRLDDGSPLVACFHIDGDHAVLDFAGSGAVHPANLNATPAIVRSVSMYVMRLLVDLDLPLNEGLLDPVEIRIPEGLLNPPFVADPAACPAVVGGNVETSQRLVDTLLLALELAACSQGTMNNLSFGAADFGYYETVAGGSGATASADGAGGVHSHMTNTRITDPEVLEHRYPVRLWRFGLRRGSGGAGRRRGGDGVVREIEFLDELELSLLSQHRREAPYGLAGGMAGSPGRQVVVRADGSRRELQSSDGCRVAAGDRLVLETPGGGGYGAPDDGGGAA